MPIKKVQENIVSSISLEKGQTWQMIDSSLRIELVGKKLVHYKHYNLKVKRPNVLLTNIAVLKRFLHKERAVLLPGPLPTTTASQPIRSRPKAGQRAA